MVRSAMYTTIKTLWQIGKNKTQIAKATGHDWKTVDKVIKAIEAGQEEPQMKTKPSIVDPYKEKVVELLEKGLNGKRIHEEIKAHGFEGTYSAVKKYIRKIKARENIFVRIHTLPGEEAQVDFGYVGKTKDDKGRTRKTWVFNMRLSYSRMDFYKKVYDQKVETFIMCHIEAFEYFGGMPKVVKIDNLKAAILEASFYEPVYQRMYKDFADYYGFKPIPCRVYHPNDKAKVESGIKFVKEGFFKGRHFVDGKDCDDKLTRWTQKANMRIHGTTRKVPVEEFKKEEKQVLLPLPTVRYRLTEVGTRVVYHDCHIFVDYNYYSVPFKYVGSEVETDLDEKLLRIYYKGEQIALHQRISEKGEFSTQKSHYPKYKLYSETEYQEEYQSKMAEIGPYAEQLFFLILKENKGYWRQPVRGILSLCKKYPDSIVNLACKRALSFGAHNYQIVKRILEAGTHVLPVDFTEGVIQ